MIADLKHYPVMKDSGVEWLGKVPEHWDLMPGRACFHEKKRANTGLTETTVLSLSYGRIVVKPEEKLHGLVPASFETYQIIKPGEIICRPTDLQNDKVSLRFGIARERGIITSAYMCLKTREEIDAHFNYLLFHAYDLKKIFYGLGSGLRQNLDWRDFKSLPCLVPPLPEQRAIVRFLDYVDRRLQRYLLTKQKLIWLLEEQKQAIIHRAVTRGLEHDVPLKPSGVMWLGDVPAHWDVVPLKFLSIRVQNGTTPPTSEPNFYENGTVPWYGPSSCGQQEQVGTPVRHLAEEAFRQGRARFIHSPALLVVVIGATAGRVALLLKDGSTNQQITSFELRTARLFPMFALHQIRGAESWLRATASTATIPILDAGEVSRLPVAIPPLPEQQEIMCYAEERTSDLSGAISRARREIELLHEYRSRLIEDVVTGKLDVRTAEVKLPDESDEPESLNETNDLMDEGDDIAGNLDANPDEKEE